MVNRLVEKEPAKRYQRAEEVLHDIRLLERQSISTSFTDIDAQALRRLSGAMEALAPAPPTLTPVTLTPVAPGAPDAPTAAPVEAPAPQSAGIPTGVVVAALVVIMLVVIAVMAMQG